MSKYETQKRLVLTHLQKKGSITSMEAIDMFGITRLAVAISELRDEGHSISTEMRTGKNRFGKTIHYGEYIYMGEPLDYETHKV